MIGLKACFFSLVLSTSFKSAIVAAQALPTVIGGKEDQVAPGSSLVQRVGISELFSPEAQTSHFLISSSFPQKHG